MVAVKTDRRWIFILVILALLILEVCMLVCAAMDDTETTILEWIRRRTISPDIYSFINSTDTLVLTVTMRTVHT